MPHGADQKLAGLDKFELLELILHGLAEGVVVANTRGEYLLWNAEAERIIGKAMAAVPIENWPEEYGFFHPEFKMPVPAEELPLVRALRGEASDNVELFLRNPGMPEGAYIRASGRPLRDMMGRLLGGVFVFRDTTKERASQEALHTLAAVVNASPDAILGLTAAGRIAHWSPGAAALWGYAEGEIKGRRAAVLAREDLGPRLEEFIERAAFGASAADTDFEFQRKDKTSFHGAMALAPIAQSPGRVIGISMIVRDVSEHRRLEDAKDKLLSLASHELRAPAAAVLMSLEFLKEGAGSPERARRVLELATRNCRRLVELASSCLDAEAVRTGGFTFRKEDLDLAALLREAVELNRAYAQRFGVSLEGQGLEGEARILGDKERLLQAVTNLIGNAAKFSPRGETVRVALERRQGSFRLLVSDHGPGIPEELRARLFQRFVRGPWAEKAGIEGAGLGLAIAKEVVERLGGAIGFETEKARGTVFFIEIPAS